MRSRWSFSAEVTPEEKKNEGHSARHKKAAVMKTKQNKTQYNQLYTTATQRPRSLDNKRGGGRALALAAEIPSPTLVSLLPVSCLFLLDRSITMKEGSQPRRGARGAFLVDSRKTVG
jgi:hypothetical protein